jgi:drug/metabolite transporter (DMT)-like permease
MPLLVCALSVPMLGERVGWRRWVAIVVGFIGVLIIVRPGTEAFHPAALICLAGALCAAVYSILTRKLAGIDSASTQQFYAGLIALVSVAPFAFSGWVWPTTGADWFALFAIGVFGVVAHGINTTAIRFAPPSVLAPFSYLELVYLAFASWLLFSEPPDVWFYVGAPIIILSGLYIWLRERALHQQSTVVATAED